MALEAAGHSPAELLTQLKKGSTLLKCGRSGSPHFRHFRLSEDLTTLYWTSPKKTAVDSSVRLSEVTTLLQGQKTPVFQQHRKKLCEYEAISFSLVYTVPGSTDQRSLDIVCKDKKEFDLWFSALQYLLQHDAKLLVSKALEASAGATATAPESSSTRTVEPTVSHHDSHVVYYWSPASSAPRIIETLLSKKIKGISCGTYVAACCTEEGELYIWGDTSGLEHTPLSYHPPRSVGGLLDGKEVVCACAGDAHIAAVISSGELYVWGSGPHTESDVVVSADEVASLLMAGGPQSLLPSLKELVVRFVACGARFTMALTTTGDVYAFGSNHRGQLGLGDTVTRDVPTMVSTFATKVTAIAAGAAHCAALTVDGKVYVWGDNAEGQLGLGDVEVAYTTTPQPVDIPLQAQDHIVQVQCGGAHTAVLSKLGAVFVCGSNAGGQLGLGHAVSAYTKPMQLNWPARHNDGVVNIACGGQMTMFITEKQVVWVAGTIPLQQEPFWIPTPIEFLLKKSAVLIAGSASQLAVVTKSAWIPDNESDVCLACKGTFSLVKRRHHCRNCGGLFCGACSQKQIPILKAGYHEPVRVCNTCFTKLTQFK